MKNRSCCRRPSRQLRTDWRLALRAGAALACCWLALAAAPATASEPPDWLRALTGVLEPEHDEKASAVVMYTETVLSVQSNGKLRRLERVAYRILRPDGERLGNVRADFDDTSPVTDVHAWSIPPAGKYFEVKNRDAIEAALSGIEGGELVSDVHSKLLRIPSATPGSLIGYEISRELRPYLLSDEWLVQDEFPVREAHYSLELPTGWDYKATWINHAEVAPTSTGNRRWTWTVSGLAAVPVEDQMPPWRGIAGRMVVSLMRPGSQSHGWTTWGDVGAWYTDIARGRRDISPAIQQKASELTAGETTPLGKIRALARFTQSDIRYVAIELGIGGQQPHPAADVFTHRYGDCKDKATLLSAMLKAIGIDSYYVLINTVRGTIAADTPPNLDFDHVILAIQLPPDTSDPTLVAAISHPALGKLLFFDPTDSRTPLGGLSGPLQANYGLLVAPTGGELLPLPQLTPETNSVTRTATLTLDEKGTLRGDVREVWVGDRANFQRYRLRSVTQDADRIKPIETVMAHALSSFQILKASVLNIDSYDRPFEWRYTIEADNYSKSTGDLLLIRPRVFGERSTSLLETKEPRRQPVEFDGPLRDTDVFEIALPAGFEADDLPPASHLDYDFGSYRSKTELVGHTLKYTRSIEIRKLSVPTARTDDLKSFYRQIFADERRTAVLKKVAH